MRDQKLRLLGAIGIGALQAKKPEMQVSAAKEPFEESADPCRERTVALAEAFVPHPEELVEVFFDDFFELVAGAAGLVACLGDGLRHGGRRWGAGPDAEGPRACARGERKARGGGGQAGAESLWLAGGGGEVICRRQRAPRRLVCDVEQGCRRGNDLVYIDRVKAAPHRLNGALGYAPASAVLRSNQG